MRTVLSILSKRKYWKGLPDVEQSPSGGCHYMNKYLDLYILKFTNCLVCNLFFWQRMSKLLNTMLSKQNATLLKRNFFYNVFINYMILNYKNIGVLRILYNIQVN